MQKRVFYPLLFLILASVACVLTVRRPSSSIPPAGGATPRATASAAVAPTPAETPALLVSHGAVVRDITYCTMGGMPLRADVYFSQFSSGKVPLLIFIHGGGWTGGSKSGGMGFDGLPALTYAGYTLASIDYRLAPEYKMPAMIEDVKCAVRSFRAHAAEYGIDPDHIGVLGASAGGHLAAMLGTAPESAGFDVGEYMGYSSRVQAVVDMAGPTDFRKPFFVDDEQAALRIFGISDPDAPLFAAASPVTWVSPDDPPFLIIHGDQDQLVPLIQSQELYDKLVGAGVDAQLIIVKNAGHGVDFPNQSPTRDELIRTILDFLQKHLK